MTVQQLFEERLQHYPTPVFFKVPAGCKETVIKVTSEGLREDAIFKVVGSTDQDLVGKKLTGREINKGKAEVIVSVYIDECDKLTKYAYIRFNAPKKEGATLAEQVHLDNVIAIYNKLQYSVPEYTLRTMTIPVGCSIVITNEAGKVANLSKDWTYIGGSVDVEDYPENVMTLPTKGIYFFSKPSDINKSLSIFIYKNL